MNRLSPPERRQNDNLPISPQLMADAGQELGAFFNAVAELFGQEQATLAAKDWLRHLEAMEDLPASPREWRLLSIDASVALAKRVNANGPLPPEDPCGL